MSDYRFLGDYAVPSVIVGILLMTRVFLMRRRGDGKIDEKLLEERLGQFEPRSLLEYDRHSDFEELRVAPQDGDHLNFARVDFLSLADDVRVLKSAEDCIRNFGIGTCGPRAFYGNFEVHLILEKRLAEMVKMEDAVVYSYGFTTVSSSLSCYGDADNIIFVDETCNIAIQRGIQASKSRRITFKHNDPTDLHNKVKEFCDTEFLYKALKILIIEGIYEKDGTICPLPDLLKICKQFKLRIFIDETISFGVLGEHGHGVTEHFKVDVKDIDMIIGSLETALVSIGGFCVGSAGVVEHQRIASKGYCYSASLPAYSAQAALTVIDHMESRPVQLRYLSFKVHQFLASIPQIELKSHCDSPMKVFRVKNDDHNFYIKRLNEYFKSKNVYVLLCDDGSLKINLYYDLYKCDGLLDKFFKIVEDAIELCLETS